MEQLQLRNFEALCVQEEPPACQTSCPLHVDARAFAALMAAGKYGDARKLLDRFMPLACLLGYLCEGPCAESCRRAEIDEGINMAMLERACVAATSSSKPFPLPGTGKKVSVAGSGLSGLVVAYELAKKGHSVKIFHAPGALGGNLLSLDNEILPPPALQSALELLTHLRVEFVEITSAQLNAGWLASQLDDNLAVYIGQDDEAVVGSGFGLTQGASGSIVLNPATLETSNPKVFAGGGGLRAIDLAFEGKKAMLSIDRLMQGVSPSVMRDKEGPYPSRLYTNLEGIERQEAVPPVSALAPTLAEAKAEAARCIQCQCLECVKNCAFLAKYNYPKKLAREVYNNLAVVQGLRQANQTINSCAECGLCAQICPQNADMGEFCGIARDEMVRTGHMPASFHEFALEDMHYSNDSDIAFIRHQPGAVSSSYLFFPGCQLPASMPGATGEVYEHLVKHLKGGVGLWFACCGSPAKWAGRSALVEKITSRMRKIWEEYGKPEVILACSSCMDFFQSSMPDLPVTSLWEVMAKLPLPPKAKAAPLELALHDPCSSRKNAAMQKSVRDILQKLGQQIENLALGGTLTRCCGYGGLSWLVNPAVADEMAMDRSRDTQNILLSYCIMCRDRLKATGHASLHALDLLFPSSGSFAASDAEKIADRAAPGISDRQYTRLLFRQHILKNKWHELAVRNTEMDKIKLVVPDNVASLLEKRRILHSDIQKVLLHESSAQFYNEQTGHTLACFKPKNVTFWVEYSPNQDGTFTVHDAYCHRMNVPGVPKADLASCDNCSGCSNTGQSVEEDI